MLQMTKRAAELLVKIGSTCPKLLTK